MLLFNILKKNALNLVYSFLFCFIILVLSNFGKTKLALGDLEEYAIFSSIYELDLVGVLPELLLIFFILYSLINIFNDAENYVFQYDR